MTYVFTLDTIHAEAQQEAFAQLEKAGRRVLVVFSHVFSSHFFNNINNRKGAFNQNAIPAAGAFALCRSFSRLTQEVPGTNSL